MKYDLNNRQKKEIDVSIVIVSFNTKKLTRKCLMSVKKYAGNVSYEVFVVDNASQDGSADMVILEFPWVKLIQMEKNIGFAGGNNPAMRKAVGKYVLLLNSDAFLAEDVLHETIHYMNENHDIGILGCKLTNPDGSMQPSARMLPGPINKILHITGLASKFPHSKFFGRVDFSWWDHSSPRIVGWVVGAFFLIRRSTINDIGFLDNRYFLYFEEIDYCLSAKRAGWNVVFYPYAQVVHLGGQSAARTPAKISSKGKQMISIRITSELRYYRKMYGPHYVLMSALIESGWNLVILIRNMFRRTPEGNLKMYEAIVMIKLIMTTLLKDRFGKG